MATRLTGIALTRQLFPDAHVENQGDGIIFARYDGALDIYQDVRLIAHTKDA